MSGVQPSSGPVINVRTIGPRERHAQILHTFHKLTSGQGFVFVNTHDPKPRYCRSKAGHDGAFAWNHLDRGPDVWHISLAA